MPTGPLSKVDGTIGAKEWDGAAEVANSGYRARLRLGQGRVLTIAIEGETAYRGERIDLHVADPQGENYSIHTFHPAGGVPGLERLPVAPVITRHTSWGLRLQTRMSPPLSCLFRARVLQGGAAPKWSAEFAIDFAALDVSHRRPVMMRLDLAFDKRTIALLPGGSTPERWTRILAAWDLSAPALDIPEEDARRTLELDLFRELAATAGGRPPAKVVLAPALEKTMNRKRIDELLGRLDACLEADPGDLFAALMKAQVLRRAHRFGPAREALAATRKRFPGLNPARAPYAAEAFALAVASNDLDAAVGFKGLRRDELRRWQLLRAEWQRELAQREAEAKGPAPPRIEFETSRGKIVVVLHEDALPNAAAYLIGLVESGAFTKRPFRDITGGIGAVVRGRDGEAARPAKLVGSTRKRAWRGTLALVPVADRDGAQAGKAEAMLSREAVFVTGPAFLRRDLIAVGRVVAGQEHLDSLELGNSIVAARVLGKRNHKYEVRR